MKKYLLSIMLVLFSGVLKVDAQVSLHADRTEGCGRLEVYFTLSPKPDADTVSSIVWDFGNGETATGSLETSFIYETPGSFLVTATVNESVRINLPDTIHVYPVPNPDFFYTDSLEAGDFAFVFRSHAMEEDLNAFQFKWSFGDGDTAIGKKVFHAFNTAGNYPVSLTLSGPPGCTATNSEKLQVNDLLTIPNIFTPNGDGRNDYFRVRTNGENRYSFTVYSRAGVMIYKSESPSIVWDGRSFSGEEMRNGIYYYTISQLNGEPRFQKKGFVHLIR